ncbi:hypothetical protein [Acinetobacter sp. Ac_5812]|uniref:hypothetical protein n=1 Tax=Acinetobacter sp. Ac_5812 TaxID=1848937 RepID=UPI0014901897|nr:hypothetical protein [Acinetobacter sp. Ac_5812]NNP67188.1 hypothetical protein [Acinetobacter sp. Ac_5812]
MNSSLRDSYFHQMIRSRKFSEYSDIKLSCLLILDYLIIAGRDLEVTFSFDELREKVDHSVSDEDFVSSVFYLTREDIDILEQGFSAWREVEARYVPVRFDKVNNMIESNIFSHPFTGEDLTEEQFYDEVISFFGVTQNFLDHKNDTY